MDARESDVRYRCIQSPCSVSSETDKPVTRDVKVESFFGGSCWWKADGS